MVLSILLGVYLLSFLACYRHIQINHGENGTCFGLDTELSDLIVCFVPAYNTLSAIIGWVYFCPYEKCKEVNYNKFFRIKKP